MAHVATEMEREGFTLPLLIGGATTSKAHTAVKIAPGYNQPVVHVLDASRAVGVVGASSTRTSNPVSCARTAEEYERIRSPARRPAAETVAPLEEARANAADDWKHDDVPKPEFTGVRVLATDRPGAAPGRSRITWPISFRSSTGRRSFTPGNCAGVIPAILQHEKYGEEARKLFEDAQALLEQIVRET